MKNRLVKGVISAVLALSAVIAVPHYTAPSVNDTTVISVHAAGCTHNYRHYLTYSEWKNCTLVYDFGSFKETYQFQYRFVYDTCNYCFC